MNIIRLIMKKALLNRVLLLCLKGADEMKAKLNNIAIIHKDRVITDIQELHIYPDSAVVKYRSNGISDCMLVEETSKLIICKLSEVKT